MIFHGDCLEVMKDIEDNSIDMILCDLPYGTTDYHWDLIIPADKLWEQYERIITDCGVIVLFGSQPFSTTLIMSNLKLFKYECIWEKSRPTGFTHSKNKPMKLHENILIFSKGAATHKNLSSNRMTYNPQDLIYIGHKNIPSCGGTSISSTHKVRNHRENVIQEYTNYPKSIIKINNEHNSGPNFYHPTQKPIKLLEYLIKTYSNEGDMILDNTAGSGSTAIAAINTDRRYIMIEKDLNYFNIMRERIDNHVKEVRSITSLDDIFV